MSEWDRKIKFFENTDLLTISTFLKNQNNLETFHDFFQKFYKNLIRVKLSLLQKKTFLTCKTIFQNQKEK